MLFKDVKKGFSLLELILVLGVGTMVAFMKFQDMKNDQESILASAVGQQMKQIGEAVNGYINIRYDKLSTLSGAAGNGTDPGPRTCSGATCEITYQTLVNEGLLPSSFNGYNIIKSPYKILLKRDGSSPNYVINGLITTASSWTENGAVRYDLLGKSMQAAGIDSGVTKTTTSASGFNAQWSEISSNFNNITSIGQLAFRVGYNSALYSMYLRRDGTLPMTGDLNMGGNNINNAKDITASGKGSFGGDVTSAGNINAAKEVTAHNGYGDAITIGGDAATNDYEIRLGSAKPLSIYGPSLIDVNISGNLKTSADVNAEGSIGAKGNINAGNWLSARNTAGDKMMIGGDASGDYDIVFQPTTSGNNVVGFFSSGSATPFDFNFRGSVNVLNAPGTQKGVGLNGITGEITASGNLKANTLLATSTFGYGNGCTDVGAISKDNKGNVLVCSASKLWVKSSSAIDVYSQDLSGSLPILTTGLVSYCSTTSQQQYSINITPIQDEVFTTSFTASLLPATAANSPTSGSDYDRRIALMRTGTGCVLVNDVVCTAQSNIEAGRTGAMTCIRDLKAGQTYTVKWVLGNNTEVSMKSSRFLVQYTRFPL